VHLLRRVTWPNWASHRVRNALTVLGVALGVATVAGIADTSKSDACLSRPSVLTTGAIPL